MVTGIRSDRFAEEHRVEVETPKRARDVGRLQHPELYGLGDSDAVDPVRSAPARPTGS
jgi:hypothetical protein